MIEKELIADWRATLATTRISYLSSARVYAALELPFVRKGYLFDYIWTLSQSTESCHQTIVSISGEFASDYTCYNACERMRTREHKCWLRSRPMCLHNHQLVSHMCQGNDLQYLSALNQSVIYSAANERSWWMMKKLIGTCMMSSKF